MAYAKCRVAYATHLRTETLLVMQTQLKTLVRNFSIKLDIMIEAKLQICYPFLRP